MRLFKILSVAFLMLLTLPFSLANADEKLKVGFVYVGSQSVTMDLDLYA